jgi:hypothetical protein
MAEPYYVKGVQYSLIIHEVLVAMGGSLQGCKMRGVTMTLFAVVNIVVSNVPMGICMGASLVLADQHEGAGIVGEGCRIVMGKKDCSL